MGARFNSKILKETNIKSVTGVWNADPVASVHKSAMLAH